MLLRGAARRRAMFRLTWEGFFLTARLWRRAKPEPDADLGDPAGTGNVLIVAGDYPPPAACINAYWASGGRLAMISLTAARSKMTGSIAMNGLPSSSAGRPAKRRSGKVGNWATRWLCRSG